MNKNRLLIKKSSFRENLLYMGVYISTIFVCLLLFGILGNIFWNGASYLTPEFIFGPTSNQVKTVTLEPGVQYNFKVNELKTDKDLFYIIEEYNESSKVYDADHKEFNFAKDQKIQKVNNKRLSEYNTLELKNLKKHLSNPIKPLKVKIIVREGGGIFPLIVTTLFAVLFSLLVAMPIGIFSAIFLKEYNINKKLNRWIHFAINSLSGIPSVIFGLFGVLFFSVTLSLRKSLLAGIFTVAIMLLPIIIKTVEEALDTVSDEYREAALGLGASRVQTIFKVILPAAIPGILVAVILAIGRIIGESAIFIFVVGTTAAFPSFMGNGSTLTAYAYNITRESSENYNQAYAIGAVIIIIVLILNLITKLISKKIMR